MVNTGWWEMGVFSQTQTYPRVSISSSGNQQGQSNYIEKQSYNHKSDWSSIKINLLMNLYSTLILKPKRRENSLKLKKISLKSWKTMHSPYYLNFRQYELYAFITHRISLKFKYLACIVSLLVQIQHFYLRNFSSPICYIASLFFIKHQCSTKKFFQLYFI